MARPIVLSNGQLFVGLDENGLVHDFYYPYVGLENLTTARSIHHKIGVWIDKKFSWVDDGSWEATLNYEPETLISNIKLVNSKLGVSLHLQDYIDNEHNSFVRHITIKNESSKTAEIRLFMHQVFELSGAGHGDTALYVPDDHYIYDYKGRYSLLAAGKFADGQKFDQFATGVYKAEDKVGTYLDAEDGELSGNPVQHGSVDSVIRFSKKIKSGDKEVLDYWLIASSSQTDAQMIHNEYNNQDMAVRLQKNRRVWQDWLRGDGVEIPELHRRSLDRSLLVIKAHCDVRGSVLASGDSSIFNYGRDYYCYCWPRDAVYALWPLVRTGHFDEVKRFLEFARDTLHPDGYLMHKYQPDRAVGSTWHPLLHGKHKELAIQEDETASVVILLGEYYEASNDKVFVENLYHSFVVPSATFMASSIDDQTGLPHASYDLWEEKFLTTTYTTCSVIAALETATKLAVVVDLADDAVRWQAAADGIRSNLDKLYVDRDGGYFCKGFYLEEDGKITYDSTLDISSMYGPFMFAKLPLSDSRLVSTVSNIEQKLLNTSPSGGVIRYENDNYFLDKKQYKGNPWMVCTLWLAQYYSTTKQDNKALKLLEWAIKREFPSGVLSEQFDPESGLPLGVAPLVWSHAELVNTILDIGLS